MCTEKFLKYNYVEIYHLSLWQLAQDSRGRPQQCVNPGSNIDLRGKDKDSDSLEKFFTLGDSESRCNIVLEDVSIQILNSKRLTSYYNPIVQFI